MEPGIAYLGPVGTDGDDVIVGTTGDDYIDAGAGNDVICGRGGNDVIDGGDGNDIIVGGAGNDDLNGGPGRDRISGGSGNDILQGASGNDRLVGGSDDDTVVGGVGFDRTSGSTGTDSCDKNRSTERPKNCARIVTLSYAKVSTSVDTEGYNEVLYSDRGDTKMIVSARTTRDDLKNAIVSSKVTTTQTTRIYAPKTLGSISVFGSNPVLGDFMGESDPYRTAPAKTKLTAPCCVVP